MHASKICLCCCCFCPFHAKSVFLSSFFCVFCAAAATLRPKWLPWTRPSCRYRRSSHLSFGCLCCCCRCCCCCCCCCAVLYRLLEICARFAAVGWLEALEDHRHPHRHRSRRLHCRRTAATRSACCRCLLLLFLFWLFHKKSAASVATLPSPRPLLGPSCQPLGSVFVNILYFEGVGAAMQRRHSRATDRQTGEQKERDRQTAKQTRQTAQAKAACNVSLQPFAATKPAPFSLDLP